ncbi:MAG: cupin domain-containing protein [Dehalococcoidia bacterium]
MFRFLVTSEQASGSYTTMELTVPPGEGANPHHHDEAEEQFYVLEGEVTFWVADRTIQASSGDFIHIPRGTVHSFENGTTYAKLLATFGPGTGIEKLFQEEGELLDERMAYGQETPIAPDGATLHRRAE